MKKLLLSSVVLCGIACSVAFAAHEFRTPISLTRKGPIHYPLQPVEDTEWFELLEYEDDVPKWEFNTWGGGYFRCAHDAFLCKKDDCCPIDQLAPNPCANPCDCPDRGSLATLFVGKECFVGAEAFANAAIADLTNINFTPFLSFSNVCPKFKYYEKGYVWGLEGRYKFGGKRCWHVGARIGIPYKVINVENDSCPGSGLSAEGGLEGVISECVINTDADGDPTLVDYAYRLDFLSSLIRPSLPVSDSQPLVEYGDGVTEQTTIAGVPVVNTNIDPFFPPVYAVKSVNGTLPPKPFYRSPDQANTPLVPAGTNGADGDGLFFNVNTDYLNGGLAGSSATQSTLYIVPRAIVDGMGNVTNLSDQSQAIRQAVREILETLEEGGLVTTTEFFKKCCIDFCNSQHTQGIGDVDTELFAGWTGKWGYADLILGFKLPTGKENKDPRRVFFVPRGNNKHFEVKAGLEFGFNWRFLALNFFGFGGHAFQRCRLKAAPFKCATVKNIGPCVPTQVSWNYGHVAIDLTFFHPQTREVGGTIGYEFYGRGKDNICMPWCTAVDCLGNENDLDPCVLERCTDTQSHKFRGEGFCRWNWCEIFIGSSYVFSGRNVMREVEGHIGMNVYF